MQTCLLGVDFAAQAGAPIFFSEQCHDRPMFNGATRR